MAEAIEEVIFPAVSLVFLLLGIVLLASIIFSAFNPYDQIAFANTEKLRAAMDETCFKGGQEVRLNKFDLQQNTPPAWATGLFTILPRWLIKSGGDPNYVLYYESFPAGEATGWEVYHDLQNRLIVPLPEGYDGKAGYDVNAYVEQVVQNYRTRDSSSISAVVINNIILSEGFRPDFIFQAGTSETGSSFIGGPVPEKKTQEEKFFGYGKWKNSGAGDDQFLFSNYMSLTGMEKTAIKYMPCGANSLCLKTKNGVYKFPLRECKDIKSVQLVYDGINDVNMWKSLGFDGETAFKAIFAKFLLKFKSLDAAIFAQLSTMVGEYVKREMSFKISDFNAVSPCSIEGNEFSDITIKKASCKEGYRGTPLCTNLIKYPLYQYDTKSGKLAKAGNKDHYACVDSVGDKIDDLPNEQFSGSDQCMQITITKIKKYYCWTPNPFKKGDSWWNDINVLTRSIGKGLIEVFFDPPISSNTAYFAENDAVVLKPTQTALQEGMGLFEALDRKWWWGWP